MFVIVFTIPHNLAHPDNSSENEHNCYFLRRRRCYLKVSRDNVILCVLTLVTGSLAVAMVLRGAASWLEAVSFVTGAVCVWLVVKESIWNFPLGLANVATFCFVFFYAKLYADAGLQIVYFVLGVIGWYLWLYGGERRTALRIVRTGRREAIGVMVAIAVLCAVLWQTVSYFGGSASFWDALTTAISLGAQWLLNRKRLESWIAWIIVDIIYVPLYLYKELYLTSILYAVFLVMAVMGLMQWRATLLKQEREAAKTAAAAEAVA